ncbi:MAG: hypothetical protein IK095_06580, partial [Oscillospiraceae bacterium]|nr:hypothetical protein [Oscillospiraceae bacterium]
DRLIAWSEREGRCTDRFLPEGLRSETPEDLGACLRYRPARGDEGWELSLWRGERRLAGPVRVAGADPEAAAQSWVAAVWSGKELWRLTERMEDLAAFGWGDALVLHPLDAPAEPLLAEAGPGLVPTELLAGSPWQIGAELTVQRTETEQILRLIPLRQGEVQEGRFPLTADARELGDWVRERYADWQSLLVFRASSSEHPVGGGALAIGLEEGRYVDAFIPRSLRAGSPEEVGLVVRRDSTGYEAVEPLSGRILGSLGPEASPGKIEVWLRGCLDLLTLQTELPWLLENGAVSPEATQLVRWRPYTDRFDLEHIPEELRPARAEQVRGLLIEGSSLTGTFGFFPNEENVWRRVSVSMETLTLRLVDMYTGEELAQTTMQAYLPYGLTVRGDAVDYGPIRVDPEKVEAWVRENWPWPEG